MSGLKRAGKCLPSALQEIERLPLPLHGKLFRVCAGVFLSVLAACSVSFTTAHISSLKVAKDKALQQESTHFAPGDKIFARATVDNVPSKVTIKWQLVVDRVEGQPNDAPITALDMSYELPSDGSTTYDLSPPDAGWPTGTYRIEVKMYVEGGDLKDHKAISITVDG